MSVKQTQSQKNSLEEATSREEGAQPPEVVSEGEKAEEPSTPGENSRFLPKPVQTRVVNGRHLIVLDRKGDSGNYCYLDVEPFGDPTQYDGRYMIRPVDGTKDLMDVLVGREWITVSVDVDGVPLTTRDD